MLVLTCIYKDAEALHLAKCKACILFWVRMCIYSVINSINFSAVFNNKLVLSHFGLNIFQHV